jgi:hypothetical protein
MPLFTLPLTAASHPTPARAHITLPTRKRKRTGTQHESPSSSSSDEDEKSFLSDHSPSLVAASANPLSLTPDEIIQYRLAGLELDELLPSVRVKDFPHRALPAQALPTRNRNRDRKGKGSAGSQSRGTSGDEEEGQNEDGERDKTIIEVALEKKAKERGPRLRIQHLGVLTAILQRCLQEGDIARASRAWAMLIRAEVGGRGIDVRGSGYWGIGAELLIRSQDQERYREPDRESVDVDEEERASEGEKGDRENNPPRRWGSKDGLEKAKDYYERLILQHPYKRQFQEAISALDFWPVMVGCEIYGIQFEQKEGLRKVALAEGKDDDEDANRSDDSEEGSIDSETEEDNIFAVEEQRKTRRRQRRAEKRWTERDEIRQTALIASGKIAARLDELMTTPPYSDSHVLIRLRGMLALYIGDLSVAALPIGHDVDEGSKDEEKLERNRRLGIGGKDTERRLLFRQRVHEHDLGNGRRAEQQTRARKLFDRIVREGGRVGVNIKDLSGDHDYDAQELYDAEDNF